MIGARCRLTDRHCPIANAIARELAREGGDCLAATTAAVGLGEENGLACSSWIRVVTERSSATRGAYYGAACIMRLLGRLAGRMAGWLDGWMVGWLDGWSGRRLVERAGESVCVAKAEATAIYVRVTFASERACERACMHACIGIEDRSSR